MQRTLCFVLIASLVPIASAEPVTLNRVGSMPEADRAAWKSYIETSQKVAQADRDALQAEVTANKMPAAVKAPDGGDFKISAKPHDAYFASDEAKQLADIILSYQAPSGGWSKHTGYTKGPRKPGMQFTSQSEPGEPAHYLATYDNRSTTEQLHLLACVWEATKREDCSAAVLKGLNFILQSQYPTGGWPQVYPLEGSYHDDITFNDDAVTHILELLQAIANREPQFAFVDDATRTKLDCAKDAGIACILKSQIEIDGKKTVWCAQCDAITLKPAGARKFEPATLSGGESSRILEFLMKIQKPSPEIVAAIEGGLAWFESAKVTNISRVKKGGRTVYEVNPQSTEVYWARFYSIATGKPVFPGRDQVMYDTFEEMAKGNNVGYDYYTTTPASMLTTGLKKWRKMLAQQK